MAECLSNDIYDHNMVPLDINECIHHCKKDEKLFTLVKKRIFHFYFILSGEINAYQKQIKMISITSEMIWYQSLVNDFSLCFHCSVFWITSDFSIDLMQLTSKVQTPITFLFVNKNIKCG